MTRQSNTLASRTLVLALGQGYREKLLSGVTQNAPTKVYYTNTMIDTDVKEGLLTCILKNNLYYTKY